MCHEYTCKWFYSICCSVSALVDGDTYGNQSGSVQQALVYVYAGVGVALLVVLVVAAIVVRRLVRRRQTKEPTRWVVYMLH